MGSCLFYQGSPEWEFSAMMLLPSRGIGFCPVVVDWAEVDRVLVRRMKREKGFQVSKSTTRWWIIRLNLICHIC